MAAPSRRLLSSVAFGKKTHLPLLCNSCLRYWSSKSPPKSDSPVSPPGFFKRYLVDHIVDFVSKRTERLEKRYPKVFEMYRTFRSGTSTFVSETKDYYNVTTSLWGGQPLSTFTRHELEVYKHLPKDLFRIAPMLLIGVLPGGGAVIALAYLYPKLFLTHHFWTKTQRSKFWRQNLESRLHHAPMALDWMMKMSLYVFDEHMRNKLVRVVQKLEHGSQPDVEDILELLPLFKSFPYKVERMPLTYIRHLAKCLNFWSFRAKLPFDTLILQYTDQAMIKEGIENMDEYAMEKACFLRCLNPFGLSKQEKVSYLKNWVKMSQQVDENSVSFLLHCPAFLALCHPNNQQLIDRKEGG